MHDKAMFVRQGCFVYSVTWRNCYITAPQVAKNEFAFSFRPMRKEKQVGGNMQMFHVDVNIGIGFKNDSFQ